MLELWWQGLPPGVRGPVWIRAIGNELNISKGIYIYTYYTYIIWQLRINIFHFTSYTELYEISRRRCNSKLSDISVGVSRERSGCKESVLIQICSYIHFVATSSISKENSIEVIHLDILRTFPTLCFFQEVIELLCVGCILYVYLL